MSAARVGAHKGPSKEAGLSVHMAEHCRVFLPHFALPNLIKLIVLFYRREEKLRKFLLGTTSGSIMGNKARWGRATPQEGLVGGLWMCAQTGRRLLPGPGKKPVSP